MNKIGNICISVLAICTITYIILVFFGGKIHLFNDFLNKRSIYYSGGIGGTAAFYTGKEYLLFLSGFIGLLFFILSLLVIYIQAKSKVNKDKIN
ncbi:hypothetical protein SAMN05421768_11231 [Chryseobacterium joostei]|uniref:Uncharacterized protein n=1 Tax=Chryseobacterium joostei TaxID=112234 RepID=A0A1N7KH02_9FLAO|nr:hypothetical protein [Chryseobacterium joostei]SIS60865.1 hypothetical protein SAMN05421768_11231 [Chryseobacterium joostei]